MNNALWALILGLLASAALPIGAILGIVTKVSHRVSGALAGFGAGALFAALAIELVAPRMMGENTGSGFEIKVTLLIGAVFGGLIFVICDHLLNAKGGYLRKTATAILYLAHRRTRQLDGLMNQLAQSEFFRSLPPAHMHLLVDRLHESSLSISEVLFHQGDEGDRLYILEEGQIDLTRGGKLIGTIVGGEIIGEIAIVTGSPRTASGTARSACKLLELTKRDFERICKQSQEFAFAVRNLAGKRLEELGRNEPVHPGESGRWAAIAAKALRRGHKVPTPHELRKEASELSGAPMAIFLGALLDGIPESFVLGTTFLGMVIAAGSAAHPMSAVPMTLLAGLFLSNFPEAMSSSVGMKAQGWSNSKILLLWISLTVVTAFLTVGGFVFGGDVSEFVKVGAEGLAAGAMLTMIAQTMIPEAVHLGGASVVGLSTLAGFLAAVGFKLVEG